MVSGTGGMGTRSGTSIGISIGIGAGEGSGSQQGRSAGGVADTWELGPGARGAAGPRERPGGLLAPSRGSRDTLGAAGARAARARGRSLPPGQPLFHEEQETSGSFVGAAGGPSPAQWEIVRRDPAPPSSAEPLSARPGP